MAELGRFRSLSDRDFDTGECPLLAISGHTAGSSRTSALPPKADIRDAIPHRRPSDVRFAPKSGHKWVCRGMSAYDPERTLGAMRSASV